MKKLLLIACLFLGLNIYSQNPTPFDYSIKSKNVATEAGATPDIAVWDANKVLKKIAWSSLPSGGSSVIEYANFAAFPGTGVVAKIYVDKATNILYRWAGSAYVILSPSETPNLSPFQLISNIQQDMTSSSTRYPSVNAVRIALDDKQDNLPNQSGNSGKVLMTNGANMNWGNFVQDKRIQKVIYSSTYFEVPEGFNSSIINLNDINADITYTISGTILTVTGGAIYGDILIF